MRLETQAGTHRGIRQDTSAFVSIRQLVEAQAEELTVASFFHEDRGLVEPHARHAQQRRCIKRGNKKVQIKNAY